MTLYNMQTKDNNYSTSYVIWCHNYSTSYDII